jgi:hypothetical protein
MVETTAIRCDHKCLLSASSYKLGAVFVQKVITYNVWTADIYQVPVVNIINMIQIEVV